MIASAAPLFERNEQQVDGRNELRPPPRGAEHVEMPALRGDRVGDDLGRSHREQLYGVWRLRALAFARARVYCGERPSLESTKCSWELGNLECAE